jgi:heterodisulfide reductase subunit A
LFISKNTYFYFIIVIFGTLIYLPNTNVMRKSITTGIYFSHSGNNHSHPLDYQELYYYLEQFPGIVRVWNSTQYPITNRQFFIEEIQNRNIERILLVGYHPGFIKPFFAKVMLAAGKSPENIILSDFISDESNGLQTTDYAKVKIACALYDLPFDATLFADGNPVNSETLIIGGGIAGIQASLEIANSHHKVYLVEKSGTIGGHMAMFDKTFPTLDCAACILTPKMVDVSQHANIQLMTYCEVQSISGIPGNYKVTLLQKARRVNVNTCTGCGTCAEKCPATAKSEFDYGTTMRKAIYMPFPQAVPNKYLIDADSCRYVQTGKCAVCVKFCPVENCINLDEKDQSIEINVGNIILATGFKPFDASRMEQYGYGKFPNVITSLELERLVNAAGPTGGNISLRSQDKKGNWIFNSESPEPKSLALIHCVGSRDENHNKYCSRVCCMYSLKLAHLIKEKIPEAEIFEYYIDMRAYGKGYEEFYKRIEEEGVHIIRGKTAKIEERESQLLLRTEDIEKGRMQEQMVDMVVLAVGLEPHPGTKNLADMLGISYSADGWLTESDALSNTTGTPSGGIYIAGTCQGPKDIPDSVVQGSAAASNVIQSIMKNLAPRSVKDITLETIQKKASELSSISKE